MAEATNTPRDLVRKDGTPRQGDSYGVKKRKNVNWFHELTWPMIDRVAKECRWKSRQMEKLLKQRYHQEGFFDSISCGTIQRWIEPGQNRWTDRTLERVAEGKCWAGKPPPARKKTSKIGDEGQEDDDEDEERALAEAEDEAMMAETAYTIFSEEWDEDVDDELMEDSADEAMMAEISFSILYEEGDEEIDDEELMEDADNVLGTSETKIISPQHEEDQLQADAAAAHGIRRNPRRIAKSAAN
jgi:hypothetical protein